MEATLSEINVQWLGEAGVLLGGSLDLGVYYWSISLPVPRLAYVKPGRGVGPAL